MKRLADAARFLSIPLITSVVLAGGIYGIKMLGGLESAELAAYDLAVRSRKAEGPDPRILIIGITAKDVVKYKYPIPNSVLVQALKKLTEGEAMAVGVDLVKDTAEGEILEIFKSDQNTVFSICSHGSKGVEALKSPPDVDPFTKVGYIDIPVDSDGVNRRVSLLDGTKDPLANCQSPVALPVLLADTYLSTKHNMIGELNPETGKYSIGTIVPEAKTPDNNNEATTPSSNSPAPASSSSSQAPASPSSSQAPASLLVKGSEMAVPQLTSSFGGYGKTEITGYPIMLNYRDPDKVAEIVSLEDFLAGKATSIKDRIVLIGTTDPAAQDVKRTPYSAGLAEHSTMPGVKVLAQATSQLLSFAVDKRPLIKSWPDWTQGIWIWGWAFLGGGLALAFRHPGKLAGSLGLAGAGTIGSYSLLFTNAIWVPVVAPLLGLGTSALAVYAWRNYGIDREQQNMQKLAKNQEQTIGALKQLLAQQPITGIPASQAPTPASAQTTAIPANRVLGKRYQTTGVLGAGGFATTYVATDIDRPSQPQCAIKHLTPARRDPEFVEMSRRLFTTEAEILERLGNHAQIPNLLAYFEENQEFYLVQELVVGQPLDQELADAKEPWTEPKIIDFLRQMLPVLDFIHERGVIHRDIKPSNIIRRASDNVLVLIDFGAVKEINPEIPDAATIAIGTRGYTPAEQYAGHPRFASDVYALGMIAIEAATNTSPREIPLNDKDGSLEWQPLAPVSPALAAVIDKMVAYQYQYRYQQAVEVLQDLQKVSPEDASKSA
jgi:CHASE2 domain-containing sensor protein